MLVMLIGCMTRIYEYRYWFTLKDYRVEAQSQALERRLWEVFPQRCLTFWPYFMKDSEGMKAFLERDMPVTVSTKMEGLGHFRTRIDWLNAWVKVEWRGQIWCISRDGRMWLYEQGRPSEAEAGSLVWKIPEEGGAGGELNVQPPMFGVFASPIDTGVIGSFLDEFRGCKWFEAAREITWERRAGMNLFVLKLEHGRQKFELYLQREKYAGQDIGASIDSLFDRLINEGGNHVIDATYESKIVERRL
jgi:hypothetical protein